MNGHSGRSSRRERRRHRDSVREEEITVRSSFKRKTARAAVNKMKLLEALDEEFEEQDEEEKPRRSSTRLRHTVRSSKRTAMIQISSDSDEQPSRRGIQSSSLNISIQKELLLDLVNANSPLNMC